VNINRTIYKVIEVTVCFTWGKPHGVPSSCVESCLMNYYR